MVVVFLQSITAKFVIREKAIDAQDWKRRRAETLWKEAVELQNSGNFSKSLIKWAESAKFESDSSSTRLDFLAHVYNEIGYCNYRNRNYPESRKYYELALETHRKISIFKSANQAYTMNNYALLLFELGEESQAKGILHDSLDILEKKVGKTSPQLAYVLNNMARAYNRLGQYEESEKILLRASEIESKMMVGDSPEVVTTLELFAVAAFKLREYERAEKLLVDVVEHKQQSKGEDHISVLSSMFALGTFYFDTGKHEKGEPIFQSCLDILAVNYGDDHHFYGVFLNQMGAVAMHKGQLEKAANFFDRSLTIAENHASKHRIELAVSLYNRAVLESLQEEHDSSDQKLFRSISLFASVGNEGYLPLAHYGLAIFLVNNGDVAVGILFAKLAAEDSIERKIKGVGRPNLPRWFCTPKEDVTQFLGRVLEQSGRRQEAQALAAKLNYNRKPVSTLHKKTEQYLSDFWGMSKQEEEWAGIYNAWLQQARIWGEAEDNPVTDDPEEARKPTQYSSIEEVVAAFVAILDGFRQSNIGTNREK